MELIKFNEVQQITKEVIAGIVQEAAEAVIEGNINPMEAAIRIKANEEILKNLRKQLDDIIISAAEEYQKEDRSIKGVEFNVVQGRTSFDFSEDAEWKDLKAKLAAREAYLKAMPTFDPETGEKSPVKLKYGKDYLTIKFPK